MFAFFLNRTNYLHLSFLIVSVFAIVNKIESKKSQKLPDYIHLCKKDDPQLNKCLEDLFETLRPKLAEGIAEIDLPPLDPLVLKEVVVLPGGRGQMKAIGRDLKITGISNYKINHIKVNVDALEIDVSVYFPYLRYEGTYDVNAKFVNIPVKGKGPMSGNATDVTGTAIMKARFVDGDGERYVEFNSAKVDVTIKDYSIRVEKLFPDKQLNDAINALLNDRKLQSMATAKPIANKVAGNLILDLVNKIAKKLSFDEVFA